MDGHARMLRIVAPLLLAAAVIGGLRLLLLTVRAPESWVHLFSLTGIQLIGVFYVPLRLSWEQELRFFRIWLGLIVLFALCQLLYAGGVLLAFWNGFLADYPTLLGEPAAGQQQIAQVFSHLWLHFQLWVLVLPFLWAAAASILLMLARRFLPLEERSGKREVSSGK